MTRWYVWEVLFHERDDEGRVIDPPAESVSQADSLVEIALARGLPEHRAREWVARQLGG